MSPLSKIQNEIKAPKGQFNKFGNYKYRSCEDIVEAAKPILNKYGFHLTITDEVAMVGTRFYVKAIAAISDGTEIYRAEAWAREEETKKGMDGAQITGAASSYARKYALNGLFAIDDTKDADATNTHDKPVSEVDEGDRSLLKSLVYSSDLDGEEKEKAFAAIDLCPDYKTYQKIEARLQDRQQGIETMVNPSQNDINKHIRKTVKA
jgi:hypothetical protein